MGLDNNLGHGTPSGAFKWKDEATHTAWLKETEKLKTLKGKEVKVLGENGKSEAGWRLTNPATQHKAEGAVWSRERYVSVERNRDPNEAWNETMRPSGGREVKEIPADEFLRLNN